MKVKLSFINNQIKKHWKKFIFLTLILTPALYIVFYLLFYFYPAAKPIDNKEMMNKYKSVIETAKDSKDNLLTITDEELLNKENTLIIPILGLEMPINGGNAEQALFKGIWFDERSHRPYENNNTVLSGHRFYYSWLGDSFNRANYSLYNLNKLSRDDVILLIWEHKIYRYFVTELKEMNVNDLELLQDTNKAQLTIYTCTPLPITDHSKRLVLIAK